jgi:hypothetical protein
LPAGLRNHLPAGPNMKVSPLKTTLTPTNGSRQTIDDRERLVLIATGDCRETFVS